MNSKFISCIKSSRIYPNIVWIGHPLVLSGHFLNEADHHRSIHTRKHHQFRLQISRSWIQEVSLQKWESQLKRACQINSHLENILHLASSISQLILSKRLIWTIDSQLVKLMRNLSMTLIQESRWIITIKRKIIGNWSAQLEFK